MTLKYERAEHEIHQLLMKNNKETLLQDVVNVLSSTFSHYSWIGIYVVRGNVLVLGPWKGKHPTEHTRIPLGRGICGAAARSGRTEIVDDVSKDARYLSCFLSTKSEIVVPIKKKNKVIGEIDIDSDRPAAFSAQDKVFLEKIADMLSQHI